MHTYKCVRKKKNKQKNKMEVSQETFTAKEPYIPLIPLPNKLSKNTTVSKKHLHNQVHRSTEFTIDTNIVPLN